MPGNVKYIFRVNYSHVVPCLFGTLALTRRRSIEKWSKKHNNAITVIDSPAMIGGFLIGKLKKASTPIKKFKNSRSQTIIAHATTGMSARLCNTRSVPEPMTTTSAASFRRGRPRFIIATRTDAIDFGLWSSRVPHTREAAVEC